jgi:hypothetical protein
VSPIASSNGSALYSRACRLVDVTTNTGLTPLHYAAWKGRADVFKQLVNAGASLAVPSVMDTMGAVAANAGSTPLHLAAMKVGYRDCRVMLPSPPASARDANPRESCSNSKSCSNSFAQYVSAQHCLYCLITFVFTG